MARHPILRVLDAVRVRVRVRLRVLGLGRVLAPALRFLQFSLRHGSLSCSRYVLKTCKKPRRFRSRSRLDALVSGTAERPCSEGRACEDLRRSATGSGVLV